MGFPEAHWAPITTLIVMQSGLGAALTIALHRFAGTALGAVAGALLAERFGPSAPMFGAGVFALSIICALPRLGRVAYRFASITLAIVMLAAQAHGAWVVAPHRFLGGVGGDRGGAAAHRSLAAEGSGRSRGAGGVGVGLNFLAAAAWAET
jgi:uncharacterized membrane protein YgaE (UPF0421/DUF939 family)